MGVSPKARFTTSALATTMQPSAFWKAQSAAQVERRLAVGRRRPHGRLPKSTIYNIRTSHHHATKCFWEDGSAAQVERRLAVGRRRPHGRLPKSTAYNIRSSHHLGGSQARLQPSTTRRSIQLGAPLPTPSQLLSR